MSEYKPNSNKYKEEQKNANLAERKKIDKVVKGTVKTKKKGEIRKFADIFISEDVGNVKSYVLMDVLVPAIKKAISDIVTDGIDMILYGGSGRSRSNSSGSKPSYVSYNRFSDRNDDRRGDRNDSRSRARFDCSDIIFESRGEAEAVRAQMEDVIEQYGFVTVADLYDMVGLNEPYTSNKYGWMSIRSAEVCRVRDGYVIKLPKASPID